MHPEIETAFSLAGRLAVVTGAASGIGRQTALTLARAGARIVAADIDGDAVERLAREIGNGAVGLRVDVADRAQVNDLANHARYVAPIDVWANVAGIIAAPAPVCDVDEEVLDRMLAVNLKGTYWGCAAAARVMVPQRRGSIINVSSAGADIPVPGLSVYAMTKAAINMLTRSLAVEVGADGVRVNTIAPGFIDTPMVTYRFTKPDGSIDMAQKEAIFQARAEGTALHMIGEPMDIAFAMLYLASDASRFVTGQVIRPNGGSAML